MTTQNLARAPAYRCSIAHANKISIPRTEKEVLRLRDLVLCAVKMQATRASSLPVGLGHTPESLAHAILAKLSRDDWQALRQYAHRAGIQTWLQRVVRNYVADLHRHRSARLDHASFSLDAINDADESSCHNDLAPDVPAERTPVDEVCSSESMERLRSWINSIENPVHRAILTRAGEGDRPGEIAASLQISPATVYTCLSRARNRLRKIICE
jgi:RNA polymerase sigma factor (sigma-70 family)